jgi:hypothetical protein
MTTEDIRTHEREMAVQRERFQRFWDCIIEPSLGEVTEREKCAIMHRAWNLWRTAPTRLEETV